MLDKVIQALYNRAQEYNLFEFTAIYLYKLWSELEVVLHTGLYLSSCFSLAGFLSTGVERVIN